MKSQHSVPSTNLNPRIFVTRREIENSSSWMERQLSVPAQLGRAFLHPHYTLSVPSSHTYNTTALYFIRSAIILYAGCCCTNIETISGIIRPPSQTKCNHPSSISSSLHLFRQVLIYPPLPPCFIHPGLRFTLICGLKGPRLATAPLRAGLINYPPSAAC